MHNIDPQIHSANQEIVVSRISARRMEAGEYRRVLFKEADLQEKIFILCQYNDCTYYINLYRRQGRRSFTEKEIGHCRTLVTVATAFLDKHVALLPQQLTAEQHSSNLLEELNGFFSAHPAKLSQREAVTCAYIVTGHSIDAIALHLGVSLNTVRTFRRRAYAKLNLASQSELFALFLENSEH